MLMANMMSIHIIHIFIFTSFGVWDNHVPQKARARQTIRREVERISTFFQ